MNNYGSTRSIATKLVPGEPIKAPAASKRIPRSSRHFSAMKGTEQVYSHTRDDGSDVYRPVKQGLAKYDLLALDPTPRDIKSSSTLTSVEGKHVHDKNSLLRDRYALPVRSGQSVTHQSYNGFRYTPNADRLRAIRNLNSTNHILNPTGGNICGKCGYDAYCTCPKPVWAGGSPVTRPVPVVSVVPVLNGGIWLRGTKVYAILA